MSILERLSLRKRLHINGQNELPGPHLIIGLGNPGREYQNTRHNAGFKAIDALAEEIGANYWKTISETMVTECRFQGDQLILAKPQRFMNLSGQPVKALLKHYGFTPDDLLVIHDELDLPETVLRFKQGGGSAGHKGIKSISDAIGTDFCRLRVGIGRPPGQMPADRFVLQELRGEDLAEFEANLTQAVPVILAAIEKGVQTAMNEYHSD
ncbi:MAG: aminoacyl-tRNA hydrolase [Coriobacteriales bacterium]|jgi:PTH1 family peptidyl-tRNA hydrolase|nr:aminoacyl-tRNA hydrolase [Coriobacteriales bacterium]